MQYWRQKGNPSIGSTDFAVTKPLQIVCVTAVGSTYGVIYSRHRFRIAWYDAFASSYAEIVRSGGSTSFLSH